MLSTLEVEDTVAVRDVVAVLRPGEMVLRFAEEIEGYLVELGEDGRLIRLQIEELEAGVGDDLRLVVLDYVALPPGARPPGTRPPGGGPLKAPSDGVRPRTAHTWTAGARPERTARGTNGSGEPTRPSPHSARSMPTSWPTRVRSRRRSVCGASPSVLDLGVEARGYRLLHRLPRLSNAIVDRIVDRFGTLPLIMQASLAELEQVGGVGSAKARSVQDGLARIIEASILERYE